MTPGCKSQSRGRYFQPGLWLWLCVTSLALGFQSPQSAHAGLFSVSPSKERQIGQDAAKQIEAQSRIVSGPVADWVESVGQRLASVSDPEFKYSFKVIDSPEINAFALPGGYVYVFTGLRRVVHTDDELAAVIAHEITHAEQHHFAQQYKKNSKRGFILDIGSLVLGLPNMANQALGIVNYAVEQKYSRGQESEADHLGMMRMVRAGFKPQGMVTLLNNLSKEMGKTKGLDKWFGDHPDSYKRVDAAQQELGEIRSLQAQNNTAVQPAYAPWQSEFQATDTIGTEDRR
ncbi:MAG: M48 family metalloprotease [Abitibacteriaceae bacterium]|nr:M48 family metalloprotease [Abditibacteriaceae bacterium]MBV9866272.1 M48 family metalloprotease [Abditibacteriaceae bacterium]